MSGPTTSELGLDLSKINSDAVNIYTLLTEVQKNLTENEDKKKIVGVLTVTFKMLERLQGLEGNLNVTLETLDKVILGLQGEVEGLKGDKLALEKELMRIKSEMGELTTEKESLKDKDSN